MNYLTEIKAFYDLVQIKRLSTGQIALWHALMAINNKCDWIEWFTVSNLTLQLLTGLSRQGVNKDRNVLKQLNIIDFKTNTTKATSYKLITMSKSSQISSQDSSQIGSQISSQDSSQVSCTLNKLNKTKLNETKTDILPDKKLAEVIKYYESNITLVLPATAPDLIEISEKFSNELIFKAIDIACKRNNRNLSYIEGILNSWERKGYKCLADIQENQGQKENMESAEEKDARITKLLEEVQQEGDYGD